MAKAPDPQAGRIVSISTALFDGYPMELAIDEIARSGARHIEPAYIRGYVDFTEDDFAEQPAKRVRGLVEMAGLSIHAISAHMDLSLADAPAMLARRIAFAGNLGARVLITNAGPAAQRDAIVSTIGTALPLLKEWGGVLAIENPGHGSGDLVGNAVDGSRLCQDIGSTHVRLNHDAGNVFTYSREALQPAEDFLRAPGAICHAHLKDISIVDESWQFCAIGSGDVDIKAYLETIPPWLPLSLELPLRLTRPGRSDPQRRHERRSLAELREALAQSLDFVTLNDVGAASVQAK